MNNVWYIYCGGVYFLLVVHLFSFSYKKVEIEKYFGIFAMYGFCVV